MKTYSKKENLIKNYLKNFCFKNSTLIFTCLVFCFFVFIYFDLFLVSHLSFQLKKEALKHGVSFTENGLGENHGKLNCISIRFVKGKF